MVCKKFTIDSCQCVPKEGQGEYAYVKEYQPPFHQSCLGDSTTLNCICS